MNLVGVFFGAYLAVFVVSTSVLTWWLVPRRVRPIFAFTVLWLASLAFVLTFVVVELRRGESQFGEIGQYYSLDNANAPSARTKGSSPTPVLSIGDANQNVDYVLDGQCKGQQCFSGRIDFFLDRQAGDPNVLSWQATNSNGGTLPGKETIVRPARLYIREAPGNFFTQALDRVGGLLRNLRSGGTPEKGELKLAGETNSVTVVWTPPVLTNSSRNSIELNLIIELNPQGASPRIVVEHDMPRNVKLPEETDFARSGQDQGPPAVYLTSANQSVALRKGAKDDRYIPTVKVGAADPDSNVNAFLSYPLPNEDVDDYIINNGLTRTGHAFRERIYIGGSRGVVATITSKGGWTAVASYSTACILLWLLPFWFFRPMVSTARLYALLPAIQMLLAVRFVLSLRAYLWSPHSIEAIETAVLALLLVPLMIGLGCHALDIQNIGNLREKKEGWRGYLFKDFRFCRYYAFSLLLLPGLYLLLQGPALSAKTTTGLAFYGWQSFLESLAVLVILPLIAMFIALFLDFLMRDESGFDEDYKKRPHDPITYRITRPCDSVPEGRTMVWHDVIPLLVVAAWGIIVFALSWLSDALPGFYLRAGAGGILGVGVAIWAYLFGRLKEALAPINYLASKSAQYISWLLWLIGILLVLKAAWNIALGWWVKAYYAAFFPVLLPVRTTLIFEFLILVLTLRLFSIFFDRWSGGDMPFGKRGFVEALIIFCVPPLMMTLSLIASKDTGSLLVHGPALIGATLLVTGLWSLWKAAAGRRDALLALLLAAVVLVVYYAFAFSKATTLLPFVDEHSTFSHRAILLEGTEASTRYAETGGRPLIGAIEQNWRMMNYAAEGGWTGHGFGKAVVPAARTFQLITLDDLVFSVYILGEYGVLGGWSLLLLYLAIFLLAATIVWERLRTEPLRLALAACLMLMLVFPAIYMAAANTNQIIFTGQSMPLLGLRSLTDVIRSGIILFLFAACLRPLLKQTVESSEGNTEISQPSWWRLAAHGFSLFHHKPGRRASQESLPYRPEAEAGAVASNIALVSLLLFAAASVPIIGAVRAAGDEFFKKDLDFEYLENRARSFIEAGHIWFEPVPSNKAAESDCKGGSAKNTLAPATVDASIAYQLCVDSKVKGGRYDDTFAQLAREWNTQIVRGTDLRAVGRGNLPSRKFDEDQFFQLDLSLIPKLASFKTGERPKPLGVNASKFQARSPFRPLRAWSGSLTEGDLEAVDGSVLVGAGLVLPLHGARYGERPVFVGASDPGFKDVNVAAPGVYEPQRGFSVFEGNARKPVFKISTVSGTEGALLSPEAGDFQLFLNGCPLVVTDQGPCVVEGDENKVALEKGTAPKVRLDDGDVIAYAARDASGKAVAKHVFVYSHAQIGAFSYVAWVNGTLSRYYPQGEAWPMARQVSEAINRSVESGESARENVAITIDANLNREVYGLLRKWRNCLDGKAAKGRGCSGYASPLKDGSSRGLSVTLMDSGSGALLALASDSGTPDDPNDSKSARSEQANLNLTRHRVGSAIKPFTAAATLKAFPDLYQLEVTDKRSNKKQVFGLPLGGEKTEILQRGGGAVSWQRFLTTSDNLYAVTLTLLGLSNSEGTQGLPRFGGRNAAISNGTLALELTDGGSSLGRPDWGNIFYFQQGNERIDLLDQTPLARNLDFLFGVRAASPPQRASYDTSLWSNLFGKVPAVKGQPYNIISPEIPNFAFDDIDNYADLRSVLLGGEFANLPQYGRVGAAWSNVYLAQSFSRITTGRKITARILSPPSNPTNASTETTPEWFPGSTNSPWRSALLQGLEGVAAEPQGTAYNALQSTISQISGSPARRVLGTGRTGFTIFSKTGTLDQQGFLEDSIYIFTAGIWHDDAGTFERPVTAAIYFEQGAQGRAQAFAADLLALLNRQRRFNWSNSH